MKRLLALAIAVLAFAFPARATDDTSLPTRFPIPWANSAVSPYIGTIPEASQIGVVNCAASLTDGFPPLTFVPASAGGCPPFGKDFNGILKQITQWSQWYAMGGVVPWSSSFSTSIAGYPKGAIVQSATAGQMWLNTTNSNTTNPDAAGAGWQNFYVGWTGVTAGSYLRPQITVAADGKITSAANGTYPTRTTLTSGSGTYTTPAGAKRLYIAMVGGGGGGGGVNSGGTGGTGGSSSFNSITAIGGSGGAPNSSGTGGTGGVGGTAGSGSAALRIDGARGWPGGGTFGSPVIPGVTSGAGAASYFGGGAPPLLGAASAGVTATVPGAGASGASASLSIGQAGGGGAGEYVQIQINNPSASYAYAVGAAGTAGTAGSFAGGTGAPGIIIIDVFYD